MKRVYLTETLPENFLIRSKLGADVQQKLEAYKSDKESYKNRPPNIRPYPLSKYDVNHGEKINKAEAYETIDAQERDIKMVEKTLNDDDDSVQIEKIIKKLPKHARRRASKLAPFLSKLDTYGLDPYNLIYDLTVPGVKKVRTEDHQLLSTVIEALERDSTLSKTYFYNKVGKRKDLQKRKQSPFERSHALRGRPRKHNSLPKSYFTKASGMEETEADILSEHRGRLFHTPLKKETLWV